MSNVSLHRKSVLIMGHPLRRQLAPAWRKPLHPICLRGWGLVYWVPEPLSKRSRTAFRSVSPCRRWAIWGLEAPGNSHFPPVLADILSLILTTSSHYLLKFPENQVGPEKEEHVSLQFSHLIQSVLMTLLFNIFGLFCNLPSAFVTCATFSWQFGRIW